MHQKFARIPQSSPLAPGKLKAKVMSEVPSSESINSGANLHNLSLPDYHLPQSRSALRSPIRSERAQSQSNTGHTSSRLMIILLLSQTRTLSFTTSSDMFLHGLSSIDDLPPCTGSCTAQTYSTSPVIVLPFSQIQAFSFEDN